MDEIIDLLMKEDTLETEEKILKQKQQLEECLAREEKELKSSRDQA